MPRRSAEDDLLSLLGSKKTGLSIDDIAAVTADALKDQKRDLINHMKRMIEVERVKNSNQSERGYNLHARLTAVESELRQIKKERR